MISKVGKKFIVQIGKFPNDMQSIIASYEASEKIMLASDMDQIKDSLLVDIIENTNDQASSYIVTAAQKYLVESYDFYQKFISEH